MLTVSVEAARLKAALGRFADFRRRFHTSAMRRMAQTHKKQIQHRLRVTKRGPSGEAWPPLAESTLASRRAKGTLGRGPLTDRNKLVNSFKEGPVRVGKMTLGSPLPYAAVQHHGSKDQSKPGAIRARPYAGVGTTDVSELQRALDDWARRNCPLL